MLIQSNISIPKICSFEIFPEESLKGYDLTRIYGFLAERFLSYWFQKNAKCKTMNITFYDIRNEIS